MIIKADTILDRIDDDIYPSYQDYPIDYEGLIKIFRQNSRDDASDEINEDFEIKTRINDDGDDDDDGSSTVIGIENNIKYKCIEKFISKSKIFIKNSGLILKNNFYICSRQKRKIKR